MNVVMILEEGRLGGPQIYVSLVANALKKQINNATIIIPSEDSTPFKRLLKKSGLAYKTFKLSQFTKNTCAIVRYLLFFIVETTMIYRYLKDKRFDIVYVAGGSWQYKAVIAGRLAKAKVIWHLNDTYAPFFIRCVFSLLSSFADAFIFASERTKKYYLPLIRREKIGFVIPQPVDTSHFSADSIPNRKDETSVYHNKVVIGIVANINPLKGIEVLIKVISQLNKTFDNLLFVVVGHVYDSQKKYFDNLRGQILDLGIGNIQFVGGKDDVRLFLKKFDIFLCTSLVESGPMTLWEAMSMEKAVVTTDVGDVSKYVQSGYSGEVVAVGDVNGMTKNIMELIMDEKKRRSYGSRAREIVIQNLDVSICAEKHLTAFQHIVEM